MKAFLVLIQVLIYCTLSAQSVFTRYYGREPFYSEAESVKQTPDGGYIICGVSTAFSRYIYDGYLIKTDSFGDTLWTKAIGDTPAVYCRMFSSVSILPSGNYMIIGIITRFNVSLNLYEKFVNYIKTNSNGDTLFTRIFYSGNVEWINSAVRLANDDIVATGGNWPGTYVCRIDTSGNLMWEKKCGPEYSEDGNSIDTTLDGGFIISAANWFSWPVYTNLNLIKTNSQGDSIWYRKIGGSYPEWGAAVVHTADSGYIIAGSREPFSSIADAIIVKTDKNGNLSWEKVLSTNDHDDFTSCKQTPDGNYIFAGMTGFRVLLVKTDPDGNILWQKTHPDTLSGYFVADLELTSDGGYVLVGCRGDSLTILNKDIFLIKTDSLATGFVDCPSLIITNGIPDNSLADDNGITISPNPFSESTVITFPAAELVNNILVYNSIGQFIKKITCHKTRQVRLTKDDLKSGIYLLQVRINDNIIGTVKVISTD